MILILRVNRFASGKIPAKDAATVDMVCVGYGVVAYMTERTERCELHVIS